jgi:probable DNA repair protein
MDPSPFVELPRAVSEALDRGALVLTGNQRAARTLRRVFDRRNRSDALKVWQPAAVFAWDAWTAELWRGLLLDGHATELLLSDTQEHAIWHNIIASDPESQNHLRSIESLAELAADAWRLLAQYKGFNRLHSAASSFETRTFQRWAAEFERRCRVHRWLSLTQLDQALQVAVSSGHPKLPRELALIGFDEMYPAQKDLIDSIRASGITVEEINTAIQSANPLLVRAADESEEVSTAARWAREQLLKYPEIRVAVIVPRLEKKRVAIDRTFREILSPELENITAPNNVGPYEFSVGVKLSQTPLVRVALHLLRWVYAPLPIESVSSLLVSALFAQADTEREARACLDIFDLRKSKLLRPEFTLESVIEMIAESDWKPHLTHLQGALKSMSRIVRKQSMTTSTLSYTDWADSIRNVLEAVQWGRAGTEDSIEFQTRKRWESTLDELATLDFDSSRVRYEQVFATLERLTKQTVFAPESREAPVQIMGPLEAAGSSFDALWFMGAGDLTWPSRPVTNPLLPWILQVELSMPGAGPSADDFRARQVGERIISSAASAIFSYAAETSAGKQRPTPTLDNLGLQTIAIEEVAPCDQRAEPIDLEEFSDVAPLPSLPNRKIQGGAEILKLQAACGFRAFAERRLWSTELKSIELGMDAAERGTIVHRALEYLWNEVKTQAELKQMSEEERKWALSRAIEHSLHRAIEFSATKWDSAYVEVQRKRLWNVLTPWLDIELNRDEFAVKLSEKDFDDVTIGPLRLSVRVDRVDTSEEGEIIIDYKTGSAKPADWQSARPDAPQLPLYAVLSSTAQPEAQLAEIAFARIRPGRDMALDGLMTKVTSEEKKPARRRSPIAIQMDEWRTVLTDLAEAFDRGDATVDPKNYPLTCIYCAQRILCRLNPASFDEDIDDETAFDSGNG